MPERMERLKLGLPDQLRERLEAASSAAGRSLSEEIRQRLERDLNDDLLDPKTLELRDDLAWIAEETSRYCEADWHSDARSFETLKAAILTWLELIKPPVMDETAELPGARDPATLGEAIARFRLKEKSRRTPELVQIRDALRRRAHALVRANKGKAP